jgi:hypothetical protein
MVDILDIFYVFGKAFIGLFENFAKGGNFAMLIVIDQLPHHCLI